MNNKREFSKFFIASLKRTAMNVSPLVRRKQKLQEEIAEKQNELVAIQNQLNAYEQPIMEVTGGYTTEDLIEKVVENTGKTDKNGNFVKITKWNLKYPETVIPAVEESTTMQEEPVQEEAVYETEQEIVAPFNIE